MKIKVDSKKIVAIIFVFFIALGGILTLVLSPKQVLGGFVRGYINTPNDSDVFEKVGNSLKAFDGRTSEYFVFHDFSIHAYGGIQKLINRSLIDDADKSSQVLKLNNGYLTFKENENSDLSSLQQYLTKIKKTCSSAGSQLMFVNKTSKYTSMSELLPLFYPYVNNSNYKEIKSKLQQQEISVLDIEEKINQNNMDKYSLFFKTDHHWTPQAGIWVSKNICQEINDKYGWNLDVSTFNLYKYNIITYTDSFLGSQGKRVGALFDGVDDFYVVIPKFDTNLTVEIKDIGFNATGDFQKTMLHEESITPNNLLNNNDTAYDTYMQGNHSLVKISNNIIPNGKTALLVLDSYGCVVAPYLSLQFSQLDCIDIRSYTDSVEDYITENKPDIVIYAITNHQ